RPEQLRTRDRARGAGGPSSPVPRRHRGRRRVTQRPKPKPRPKPRPKPKPRREPALQPIGDNDPLADARIRPLLQRYCRLAGVQQAALGPDHSELRLPQAERPFFRDRESLRLAFSVDALERDPDAEIGVLDRKSTRLN